MLFSKIIRKKFDAVLGRYEGNPACYYFTPEDFPKLKVEAFDIRGDRDIVLKGYFYYTGKFCADRLVVFDHGIGAGHRAYLNEINRLAEEGYTVYSYDHTGCAESGGEGILGFAQGVNDLDHVLTALQQEERLEGVKVKLIGHSWGGYSVMNTAYLHPEVTHIVSLAGFLSARALIEQYIPKMFLRYSEEVMDRERLNNPNYADLNAMETLQKTDAKLLHIQSKDDLKVKYELSMLPLSQALKDRKNTEFITLEKRGHDPQYTDDAAAAIAQMNEKLEQLTKKKQLRTEEQQTAFRSSQDWNRMTKQDPAVWNRIFEFFNR